MTTVSCSGQTFLVQLETALHRLVESFWEEPYCFFTESDAEKLAPSIEPRTYAAHKQLAGSGKVQPSLDWWYGDGVQDTIVYLGRWGTSRKKCSLFLGKEGLQTRLS